jgi:hypothetical protein
VPNQLQKNQKNNTAMSPTKFYLLGIIKSPAHRHYTFPSHESLRASADSDEG